MGGSAGGSRRPSPTPTRKKCQKEWGKGGKHVQAWRMAERSNKAHLSRSSMRNSIGPKARPTVESNHATPALSGGVGYRSGPFSCHSPNLPEVRSTASRPKYL